MALIESGTAEAKVKTLLRVGPYRKSARVSAVPYGPAYSASAVSGTIGAALASGATVFTARFSPTAAPFNAFVSRITIMYTTIVAYTTPITAGRRLGLYRGSGAQPSAQTAIANVLKRNNVDPNSRMQTSMGGDVRIANTAAITTTSVTFDSVPFATMMLTDVGAAGAAKTQVFEFDKSAGSTFVLQPGQLLAIRCPVAMDAAGTWQIAVTVDWHEG